MTSLANHFLIAMPGMTDPNFARTVTLICEHGAHGAMGIVINRPADLMLAEVFEQMSIEPRRAVAGAQPVYLGGPVQANRGFVLHQPLGHWDATLQIDEDLGISTSRDILEAMAGAHPPRQCLLALGYAGWAPGQLERELGDNAWLSTPADRAIIFDTPVETRWEAATRRLGIDLADLSGDVGHA